jgi:hypothetical protein
MRGGRSAAGVLALVGAVLVAVAGCGSKGTDTEVLESAAAWSQPDNYAYTLKSECGERFLIGTFRITVAGGQLTKVDALDEGARNAVQGRDLAFLRESVPTLQGIAAEAARMRAEGADVVEVKVDPVDGHVTSVNIDQYKNAIDDEICYTITDFTPAVD